MENWSNPLCNFVKQQWYLGLITLIILLILTGCKSKKSFSGDSSLHKSKNSAAADQINTLTSKEREEGWILLFDGKTTQGWRGVYKETFPDKGWVVEDGILKVVASGGGEADYGGDIITENQYANFELSLEFRLTKGANSGIKYFVKEIYPEPEGSAIGLEYQIIDDRRPDVKGNWTLASLYDLIPAVQNKKVNPIGEFNQARILVRGNHVEHWLNGQKVVEYTRGSERFRELVSKSKYKDHQNFGEASKGHILLQDHGHEVAFRNIKIRKITPMGSGEKL